MGGQQSSSYNEEVQESKIKGFTAVYRKKGVKELLHTPETGIETLHDLLKNTVNKYGNCRGIGQIEVTTIKDAEGKDVESRNIMEHSYREVYDSASNLGRALVKRGLFFVEPERGMRLVGIYARNRYEWFVTDWACIQFGLTSVPLYDTLGVDNLSYCLRQTQFTTLFATPDTIRVLLKISDRGALRTIISYDPVDEEIKQKLSQLGIELLFFSDLLKQGASLQDITKQEVITKPNDCYTFSYTSGTTGPPKGAMISHQNILAFLAGLKSHETLNCTKDDTYVSYLPLPHIMERSVAMMLFYEGAYLVVSCGNTLKLKDDCLVIKPTLFVSVPRIFNRIVDGVKAKFQKQTGMKKMLIDWGVSTKLKSAQSNGSYTNMVYDNLIFKKVRQSFGGRIRLMSSGSAPLNPDVHAYMKAIMCCPLIQAYGQTENTASVLYGCAYDSIYGALAQIAESAEIKLCDIPEMRYTSEDKDENGEPSPRGQIWIRGPQIFLGYYKLHEVTKDTITPDGWLKTGDIGQILPNNLYFKIIDRKKNIFKLQQGEYVAPDKVENIYLKYRLITELFVHGESSHNFAIAIACPDKEELLKLGEAKSIEGNFEQLCSNTEIKKHILTQLNGLGKIEGLYGFQQAKNIYLETQGFASRNIMTNTMKLIRFEARQSYKNVIADLYKEGDLLAK